MEGAVFGYGEGWVEGYFPGEVVGAGDAEGDDADAVVHTGTQDGKTRLAKILVKILLAGSILRGL